MLCCSLANSNPGLFPRESGRWKVTLCILIWKCSASIFYRLTFHSIFHTLNRSWLRFIENEFQMWWRMCGAYFRVIKDKESTVNKYGSSSIFNSCQCVAARCANFRKITLIGSLIAEVMKSTFFPRSIFPQDAGMYKKHWLFQCNCKTAGGVGPKGRDRDRGTDSVKCFLFSKALAGYEIRLDRWRVNGLGWSAEPFVEVVLACVGRDPNRLVGQATSWQVG